MGKFYIQNPTELKFCMLRRIRSFQRGAVGLCRSTGFKVTSCHSWRIVQESNPNGTLLVRLGPMAELFVKHLWNVDKCKDYLDS